jgi:D-alanine-D-alanine ligase
LVKCESEWAAAAEDTWRYGDELVVEAYIEGRELTVGIVGEKALPVVEITAPNDWYDYQAKYTKGVTQYVVPARISDVQMQGCQDVGVRTFRVLGCAGLGRVDCRMDKSGGLHVLELNSIPGFTETSLLPKAAAAAGIDFSALCHRVMNLARVWGSRA